MSVREIKRSPLQKSSSSCKTAVIVGTAIMQKRIVGAAGYLDQLPCRTWSWDIEQLCLAVAIGIFDLDHRCSVIRVSAVLIQAVIIL